MGPSYVRQGVQDSLLHIHPRASYVAATTTSARIVDLEEVVRTISTLRPHCSLQIS